MKASFTRSWTSTAQKIFSGLREQLFDHYDSTSLCHSKTLTAMKRSIPFVLRSSARVSLMAACVEGNFYPAFFISWRVHWPYLVVVHEVITSVRRANENARNLISVVQFLITLDILSLTDKHGQALRTWVIEASRSNPGGRQFVSAEVPNSQSFFFSLSLLNYTSGQCWNCCLHHVCNERCWHSQYNNHPWKTLYEKTLVIIIDCFAQ